MSQQKALYQWSKEVAQHLPHLSQPQARTLAAFSLGLALSRRCTLSWVADPLSGLGGQRDSARHSSPGRGGSGPGPQPKVVAGNPGSGVVLPGESARPGAFEVGPGSRGVFCQFGLQKGPELARSSPGLQKGGLAEVLGRGTVAGEAP